MFKGLIAALASLLPVFLGEKVDADTKVIASYNLDTDPGWTREGLWDFGQPQEYWDWWGYWYWDGEQEVWYEDLFLMDPWSAKSGQNIFGYNIGGPYDNYMPEVSLTSNPINCRGYTSVSLQFWNWLSIEPYYYDGASVQASSDGVNWETVWAHSENWERIDYDWTLQTVDLSAIADGQPTVYIRWVMGPTDSVVTFGGWSIDDVVISGTPVVGFSVTPDFIPPLVSVVGHPPILQGHVVTLSNNSANPINWTASADIPWLQLAPASGTLGAGESSTFLADFNEAITSLAPGSHVGTISVTSDSEAPLITRTVELRIAQPASYPFRETFEGGDPLSTNWTLNGVGTPSGVTTTTSPRAQGTRSFVLSSQHSGVPSRSDLILTLDMREADLATLSFFARSIGNSSDFPPSNPFSGDANFDGVAISVDGATWYEVKGLRGLSSQFQEFTVDLDAAVATAGLTYNDRFQIRFTHYGDDIAGVDCIYLDDVRVGGEFKDDLQLTPRTPLKGDGYVRGHFAPRSTLVSLVNTGSSAVNWSTIPDHNWVSAVPGGGVLLPGETVNVDVRFTSAADLLGAGNHKSLVRFLNADTGHERLLPVELNLLTIPAPQFSSSTYQTMLKNSGTQPLRSISVVTTTPGQVLGNQNIRINIPNGLPITFDASDATLILSGSAASKVSPILSFENARLTAVIDVLEDFGANESLVIDGLSVTNPSTEATPRNLTADFGNGLTSTDPKYKQVNRLNNYVTSVDNENNARTGQPDGDLNNYLYRSSSISPIEVKVEVLTPPPYTSAYLVIGTEDIDFPGEQDEVVLNGQSLGILSGIDNTFGTAYVPIPNPNWVQQGFNDFQLNIDLANQGWAITVRSVEIVLNGGTPNDIEVARFTTNSPTYNFGNTAQVTYDLDSASSRQVHASLSLINPENTMLSISNQVLNINGTGTGDQQVRNLTIPSSGVKGGYKVRLVVIDNATKALELVREIEIFVDAHPAVREVIFAPSTVKNDGIDQTTISARVDDPAGPGDIASVAANLSAFGLPANQPLRDDGTQGDTVAGDGFYTFGPFTALAASGVQNVTVTATDSAGLTGSLMGTLIIIDQNSPEVDVVTFSRPAILRDGVSSTNLTARVSDPQGLSDITGVRANLSSLGRLSTVDMYDNGTNGDSTAGDGIFTLENISTTTGAGTYNITVTAVDANGFQGTSSALLTVLESPELVVLEAHAPPGGAVGGTIDVTWNTENTGLTSADDVWQDCVYLSTDDQIGDDIQLGCVDRPAPIPVGATLPGSATVSIPDVPDGEYWIIVRVDQNDDIPEADDENNFAIVGPIAITSPNLVAENLVVQSTVAIGERVPISWEVLNAGTGAAFSFSEDCLYLSADNQPGNDLSLGCLTEFGRDLDPGERQSLSGNFIIPETPDGTYWIILQVDSGQYVLGDDPSDNTLVFGPVTVTRPDLQLQEITIPAEAAPGEIVDIGWTVQNVGAGLAQAAWTDQVFFSADDQVGDDTFVGNVYQWDSIPAGASYTQNGALRLPDVPDGVYHVVVVADYYHYLSDPNRADNARIVGTITLARPDLGISLTSAPEQADSGSRIAMEWQVDNHGDFRTRHAWDDCVYLSADETVGNDTPVACVSRLQDLAVGESFGQVAQVTLPQVPEGHYWLYVTADGSEDVPELNETDNVSGFLPIIVATPNIAPTALTGPSTASPLQKVNVAWTVGNNTIAAALGNWRDGIYLSNDNAAGNDTFIANFPRPSTISPGASYDQTQQVTLPDVADGQYWLVAKADDNNNLLETNENDNTFVFGPVSITRPDLQLAIESVEPQSPRSEGPLTVAWRVANGSSSPTGHHWQDCIYLSSDSAIGDDILLKCVDRAANLAGSEAYDLQTTLTLPVLAEGQYWIVVKTDAHGTVPESNEANNVQIAGPIDVRLVLPPVIAPVADDSVVPGAAYTGPVPVLTQGTEPVVWSLVEGPASMTIDETTGVVSWAVAVETPDPHIITIRATNEAGSGDASWSLSAPLTYTATVSTPVTVVPAGTPIPLEGMATMTGTGEPAPNKPVKIRLWVQNARRVIDVTSGADGAFSTVFNPLPREGGRYYVGADHPLVFDDKTDDEFSIVSMGLTPETLTRRLTPGVETTDALVLKNHGDEPLNGITYEVQGAPTGLTVSLATLPATLGPRAEIPLTLSLLGDSGTNRHNEVTVRVLSGEGAVATLALSAEVVPITPELVATPGTLRTGMLRGEQTLSETILTNIGGVETGALEVLVPEADWVALATPQILPSLEPGESAGVTLSLTPEATLDLGPYNGYYRVKGVQTNLTVPFTFTAISDARGDLKITVVDEFTYFAEGAPKVTGAEITLSDPNTGDPIPYLDPASGEPVAPVTGPDGSFTFHNLPEAYYEVAIKAPGHEFHRGTYLVPAGGVEDVEIFLSRQMVSYTWNVVPTEIEDRYDITIDLEFETHVPAPVVTIDPPFIDLIDMTEPVKQIDMTITNHGLIAAEGLNIHFPADPRITVLPLVEDIGLLPAQSSYIVPVIVYDNQYLTKNATPALLNRMSAVQKDQLDPQTIARSQKDIGFCGYYSGLVLHYYKCAGAKIVHAADIPVRWPWAWCSSSGGPWQPTYCVDCESGPGHIRPPYIVSKGVKCCATGCSARGELSGETSVTVEPTTACAGEELKFMLNGELSVTGGKTMDEECNETPTAPGSIQYFWEITTPTGKESGSGRQATTIGAEHGTYTCNFWAEIEGECAPAGRKDLGSAGASIERLVDISMQGLAEESGNGSPPHETDPGAFILLNNDLDSITDPSTIDEETKFDMDLKGPIENEDDLHPVTLYVRSGVEGKVTLDKPGGVKLFKDKKKAEEQTTLTWNVPDEQVPTVLFVEGVEPSIETNTLRLTIEPKGGSKSCVDEVKITVVEVALAMDGNFDREVKFDDPLDRKYQFWVNDDLDSTTVPFGGISPQLPDSLLEFAVLDQFSPLSLLDTTAPIYHVYDDDEATEPNSSDVKINTARDLEDFTRFHLKLDEVLLDEDSIEMSLVAESQDGLPPNARIFGALDDTLEYLKEPQVARDQAEVEMLAEITSSSTILPHEILKPENYFLLEGTFAGHGNLTLVVSRAGVEIGRRSIYVELEPITYFYDYFQSNGQGRVGEYESPESEYLLYVHGWNMGESLKQGWTHTIFKRLWWAGFKGRVGCFSWPEGGIKDYGPSEQRSFESASSLSGLLTNLSTNYNNVAVLAHSQGNIATSEALRLAGGSRIVDTYIATQAASPLDAYGYYGPETLSNPNIPDIYERFPPANQPYFSGVDNAAGSCFSIYNPQDYALKYYELGQWAKNMTLDCTDGNWYFNADGDLNYNPEAGDLFFNGLIYDNCLTYINKPRAAQPNSNEAGDPLIFQLPNDRYRVFHSIAPSRSGALGQSPISAVFRSSWDVRSLPLPGKNYHWFHSIQFRQSLADVWEYWDVVMSAADFSAR